MGWPAIQMHPVPERMSYMHSIPDESYSRRIDASVYHQEMPYGYTISPPAADTGDHNEMKHESTKQYHIKSKH